AVRYLGVVVGGSASPRPLSRPVLGVPGRAAPVHIQVIGDAVNPRAGGGTPSEARQFLPDAAESELSQVSSIRIIGGKTAQEAINALIKKLNQLHRIELWGAGAYRQLLIE